MNSSQIFDLIEQVAATPSKLEKMALLKGPAHNAELVRVLDYTYSPFKRYGLSKVATPHIQGAYDFDGGTWFFLDALAARRLTGNDARNAVKYEMEKLNPKSSMLLARIITKDLRAGFSESTCNKVFPGCIPDFPYMRCSLPSASNIAKFDWLAGVYSQEKADGMFANVDISDDGKFVDISTRQGKEFLVEDFGEAFKRALLALKPGTQTHGELLVFRDDKVLPREVGNGILNHVLKGGCFEAGDEVRFVAWDQIPRLAVRTKGKYEVSYAERFSQLVLQIAPLNNPRVSVVETRTVYSKAEAMIHYKKMLANGKEGTVLKTSNAIWKDGTSKDQVKFKLEVVVDLEIYDFTEGTGKYEGTLGAIKMRSREMPGVRNLYVSVNGRGDDMRDEVWRNREHYRGKIAAVKANAIMTPDKSRGNELHSLFLPVLEEIREDKKVADTLEEIQLQFENAVNGD